MSKGAYKGPLERIDDYCWRIPKSYKDGMRVDGLIYVDSTLVDQLCSDQAPEQVANVACLPGIQMASLAMPDIHWGYGFCIGGVCATDPEQGGVISPGGVGYDINCGIRLVRTNLHCSEVKPHLQHLIDRLFSSLPCGIGKEGNYHFKKKELKKLLEQGVPFLLNRGLATELDLQRTEAQGCLAGAEPDNLSERAIERGAKQCGTLGSGNHFVEVQVIDQIFDQKAATVFGLEQHMVCVMIHSGSRGLGYQVCDDSLRQLRGAASKYGIYLPDQQLACAPANSHEGKHYIGAMRAAANFAWCNRQLLLWQTREVFSEVFGRAWEHLQMFQIYDVAHNIAKFERHAVGNNSFKKLWVHRKGATRAFPANHPELPEEYRQIGQPVLIPGDMGTASWVLVGQPKSMEKTFGTTCHGAGRILSRTAAVKEARGRLIDQELLERGIIARAQSRQGLAEEHSQAYKDVDHIVEVVHQAGLSKKVARLRPMGVIKG
ncbi:MAG: RtcB family protein [Pseudomonadota bacterium]